MTAPRRLAAATAAAQKSKAKITQEGDIVADATSTTTQGADRPKFTMEVLATTEVSLNTGILYKDLRKVFSKVVVEKQLRHPEGSDDYEVYVAKFTWKHAELAEVMGNPSLNMYMGNNGLYVAKNADYDINGNTGKYSKLSGWAGKATISKQAVNLVKALIDNKLI